MQNLTDGVTDLRSGVSLWDAENLALEGRPADLIGDLVADVIIVGAGITGAFLAERLTRRDQRVVIIDRHAPQQGSTAASTSLLQWELDAPLLELEDRLGFERAAQIYRRSRAAVGGIGRLVQAYAIPCRFTPRDTVFLAGDVLDRSDLREEHRLRTLAGFSGRYLDADRLWDEQKLRGEAALTHDGSAEADPVALARGLLSLALARGALLLSPLLATAYDATADGVVVATERGTQIAGKQLILANGYEIPAIVPSRSHRIVSTWALASKPLPADRLWPTRALVWESSDPYLYLRTTLDGRIVVGGEDEETDDPALRDALTGDKVRAILDKLSLVLPVGEGVEPAFAWSGFFGVTEDALPLIGPVPGLPGCYAAFGYGGNGITFSAIAADLIARLIEGGSDPGRELFAVDRQA